MKSNTPRLIDTVGELSTTFDMKGQDVYKSCGVTFKNKQYIFGGENSESKRRQVLQVKHCGLVKLGSIPFDHRFGACGSNDDAIVLCFNA